VDTKLDVVVVPVSDVDRAKSFYESLGWRLDADFPGDGGFRVVQLTPPASGARSSSAVGSPRQHRAPLTVSSSSSPISRRPGPRSSTVVSR